MRRLLVHILGLLVLCTASIAPVSAHTRQEAEALVRRAAEFLHTHDEATALAAFDDPNGAFRDGDLYVYVMDATDPELTMLAHGSNPGLIGVPQRRIVDADGKDFHGQTVAIANTVGEGWVDYKWPNPVTKKIAQKSSFILKDGGLIIVAGVYE